MVGELKLKNEHLADIAQRIAQVIQCLADILGEGGAFVGAPLPLTVKKWIISYLTLFIIVV